MENKETTYNLPDSWTLTTIGEIAFNVTDGSHNPPRKINVGIPMLSARNIQNGIITFDDVRYISVEEFQNENNRTKLEKGDVLLTIVGTIGRTAIVKDFKQKFTLQRSVAVIKPSLNSKYLMYAIQSPDFQKQLVDNSKGTAQKGVYLKTLKSLTIPLPPLAEQYRIVEKIEELFSELDNAQENLLNTQKQLDIYRQLVFKDTFEEGNTQLIKLKKILNNIQYGYTAKSDFKKKGAKYLRITDIRNSNINWEIVPNCEINDTDFQKYRLFEGDILFARVGNTVGKTVIIGDNVPISVFASYLIRISPIKEKVNSKYLIYYFKSNHYWKQINESATGVAQPNINGSKLKELIIPISSIQEQERKIQEIEHKISLIENLENSIKENLKRIDIFRQVFLQKAFSGKLVPQVETDEPASELLKRIKKEIQGYKIQHKEVAKNKPLKLVFMQTNKSIIEILEEATEPIEAVEVWQKSIHKDNIENFYEELKKISADIEEIREGKISKIFLKK